MPSPASGTPGRACRRGDAVLVVDGILAAAGFTLAGVVYWWLAW